MTEALARAGWKMADIERIEINEAFAAIATALTRQLGLTEEIVNVEGGAIAHGHPIGVTGAVLTTRLLYSMQRDRVKRGSSRFASAEGKASRSLLKQSIEVRRMPG